MLKESIIFIAILFGFIGIIFFGVNTLKNTACKQRAVSFENRYSFMEGCMIKTEKDGWIPLTNYRSI